MGGQHSSLDWNLAANRFQLRQCRRLLHLAASQRQKAIEHAAGERRDGQGLALAPGRQNVVNGWFFGGYH